jgi:hypothetical protein
LDCREQKGYEDTNDSNYDEEFDERKATLIPMYNREVSMIHHGGSASHEIHL